MDKTHTLVWRQVHWPLPLTVEQATMLVERLATEHALGRIVLEYRASGGRARFLIAAFAPQIGTLTNLVTQLVPGTRIVQPEVPRRKAERAGRLLPEPSGLPVAVERAEAVTRALLAVTPQVKADEEIVLQTVIGHRLSPHLLPTKLPDPRWSLTAALTGTRRPASAELQKRLRARASQHGARLIVRIGVTADDPPRRTSLGSLLHGALRLAESSGQHLAVRAQPPARLDDAAWSRWHSFPASSSEIATLAGLPVGDGQLPGMPSPHPRLLAPRRPLVKTERVFAMTNAPGKPMPVGIPETGARYHTALTGPTGAGKSSVILNLALADVRAGRSVFVADPKLDLVEDLLACLPPEFHDKVVVIDPNDSAPVGVNPLVDPARSPELIADTLLASFKQTFRDSFGVRSEETLSAAFRTLARVEGANLMMLPSLLTDPALRRRLLAKIDDPLGVGAFWAKYEAMSETQQAQQIQPVLNKLQQYIIRPEMRAVLGQSSPRFSLSELFGPEQRIVLLGSNKGVLGPESARLLTTLVVSGQLWPLILGRAKVPHDNRRTVSIYIDEAQDYMAMSGSELGDALAQSRSLGAAFHLAFQSRQMIPDTMRGAIDQNCRNKILFTQAGKDAVDSARLTDELQPRDFQELPAYNVYAATMQGPHPSGWLSAATLPPPEKLTDPSTVRAVSAERYGVPAIETDAALRQMVEGHTAKRNNPSTDRGADDGGVGRRRRQ